ncbi:AAA family ATPase [Hymenobacter sp. 15J16-1T3B]|uniref:AAA family ATPase n=1 Tax=Hymenobacter sp. 15J16-1T3B TaxID=2886941 RepID=UPI001D12AD66|nr:AAA family ATPase [Hymenobacter sp. 15J16-1T3B]MCC3158656.1 AAA family ATPase [Hymenobacter sp. 15J16-1T3B]
MKRIKTLELNNFKAFRQQIFDFEGRHALVFGNNGSGKSSLFWALYSFLQSSHKSTKEVREYFRHFDPADSLTQRSLVNVYAPSTEEARIRLTWEDELKVTGSYEISATVVNTDNPVVKRADLASDFINYKLLQNFYNVTHKEGINLWDVFRRDIFPYFLDQYDRPYREVIEKIGRTKARAAASKNQFDADLKQLNLDIEGFIGTVARNANDFLKTHFFDGEERLRVVLEFGKAQYLTADWVKQRNEAQKKGWALPGREIRMWVQVYDRMANVWRDQHRPHSFLNEAQLTRVALAVRIGALQTRVQNNDFQVLCLDDMLISLDMSNRMQVLDWLFSEEQGLLQRFQLIIMTHDKQFYQVVRHYIETKSNAKDWWFPELYMDAFHGQQQPRLTSTNSSYLELAQKHFEEFEFPACANYLRKEAERALRAFLPPNRCYTVAEDGEMKPKMLDALLTELTRVFDECGGRQLGVLDNLRLYKNLLLNPLSHDNMGTTVHQNELNKLLYEVMPELQKLSSREVISLRPKTPTYVRLTVEDAAGASCDFKLLLLENFREYTFVDGSRDVSSPMCRGLEKHVAGQPVVELGKSGEANHLQDAYRKIRHSLGIATQPPFYLPNIVKLW